MLDGGAPVPSVDGEAEQPNGRQLSSHRTSTSVSSFGSNTHEYSEDSGSFFQENVHFVESHQDQSRDEYAQSTDQQASIDTGNVSLKGSNRTSLEELRKWPLTRTWPAAEREAALHSSLPPSAASSVVSTTSVLEPTRDSLDQHDFLRPEDVALPSASIRDDSTVSGEYGRSNSGSDAVRSRDTSEERSRESIIWQAPTRPPPPHREASEVDDYREYVDQLATSLPNFSNVATTTVRHPWSSRIVLHDRIRSSSLEVTKRLEPWAGPDAMPSYEEIKQTLKDVPNECVQRVIIVEDLAPMLIQSLGAIFQIPAHVFEEHLKDSGYQPVRDSWSTTATWDAQSSAQGFFSMTWYRAVMPIVPITSRNRTKLITNQVVSMSCVDDDCGKQHNISVKTAKNVWRHSLDLCPEPGVYHKGSRTEYPVGWEERATIWSRKIGNCNFVIMLFDPLPTLLVNEDTQAAARHQAPYSLPLMAALLPQREVDKLKARRARPQVEPSAPGVVDWVAQTSSMTGVDPIVAGSPPLSLRSEHVTGTPSPAQTSLSPSASSTTSRRQSGLSAESFRVTNINAQSTALDAAPSAPRRRIIRNQSDSETTIDSKAGGFKSQPSPNSPLTENGQISPHQSSSLSVTPTSLLSQGTAIHGPFVPYRPIKDRSSSTAKIKDNFTARQVRKYARSLQVPTSTLDEFDYFLQLPMKGKETTHDPFRPLFRVIHDDTQSLAGIIRVTSQRIREDTMDEDLMQKRVTDWRRLLHRLNVSLADIDQRLRTFTMFARDFDEQSLVSHQAVDMPSERYASDTRDIVRDCINLLDRSANSLLAEMQIVDSRRSIAEAKSVAKLTELAFIFIPLSFVASLFSMQVDVLKEPVPLYRFVLIAIALVAVVYAIRLSIRSSRILEYKRTTLLKIKDDSHLQYNQPIPTRIFLAWVGRAMGESTWTSTKSMIVIVAPVIIVAVLFAAILSPIVLLWLRGFNKGFAAVITVLMLLLDVILVYPVATTASGKLDIDPKRIVRDIKGNLELKKAEKKRAKKRERKRQGIIDPEAQGMESSDESDEEIERVGELKSVSDVGVR
ncbi:hypothetical protein T440DRAFT_517046 [Plenodomus tracheiphilus IPT5]|uniref:Cora-domain-containing protein n=1 Tax=Plenodomus tracheiphilus IPT5 TaxID=1408161 RepID=A0A6A7B968_9PLEO|nr:hypothetical protein T440DRAFT_517046 [Plenodomus tracheiphilus IPT5]